MALKLQAGEMKRVRAGDAVQINDHGVWLPGTVQSMQTDTWGTEFYVVRWVAGGETRTARKRRKDVRPVVGARPPRPQPQSTPQPIAQKLAQIKIPAGTPPGSILKAKINGHTVDVKVPPGATEGTFLRFPIPASVMQPRPAAQNLVVIAKIVSLAPGIDVMEITVPATKRAGDSINVSIPGRGAPVRVTIPPGVSAGQTFQAELAVGLSQRRAPVKRQPAELTPAQRELLAQMPPDIQAEMLMNPSMLKDMLGAPAPAPTPTGAARSSTGPEQKEDEAGDEGEQAPSNGLAAPAPAPADDLTDLFDGLSTVPAGEADSLDTSQKTPAAAPPASAAAMASSSAAPPAYSALPATDPPPAAAPATAAALPPTPPNSNELLAKLRAAKQMLDEGLISQVEFDTTKAAILNQMTH